MACKLVQDPDRLVAAIESSFPFPQKMDRYYGFDVQVFQISLPSSLQTDLITLEEQRDAIEARQRAAQEAGDKIRRGVEQFAADCVASLREQTAQLCQEMLGSINNSETGVHQKTLNRLVRFIDQFKQMNFMNDRDMEQQLDNVRRELLSKTAEEYRDSRTAKARLVNGLQNLSNAASNLAKQDASELVQRFGQVGKRKFNLAA
jgi:DNA anti-recombination protein RmuC